MSDINSPTTAEETWDLGEVLAERTQPTAEVNIYLAEAASARKNALRNRLSVASVEDAPAIEKELAEVDEEIQAAKLTVVITAVPSRMREDINSKALAKFPFKRDNLFGHDDPVNAKNRSKFENELIWQAQIVDVIKGGKHKRNWTLEEIQRWSNTLPTAVQNVIDSQIKALTEAAERFTVESQNQDF